MSEKICMFAANYLPHIGGIENYTYRLSKELISMGHHVTVVTSNLYNDAAHGFSEEIEIYRMPCYSLIGDRYPVCKLNQEFKKIDKELEEHGFGLIIIHARFYFHSVYAAKFAYRHGIKCIVIEHGTTHLSVNNKLLDFFGGIWEHGITKVLKKYCQHYYGVSKSACEWSYHFGIRSKGVLYNAVDIDDIEMKLENPVCSYKKQHGLPPDSLVITFTGRIIPEKGIVQLMSAFNELALENAYLFIAGDGSLLEELRKRKHEHIIFLGAIDFANVIALLGESDIYCLPSFSEGMSSSVLEAMATKTFVITTKRGGAAEIITDGDYGIIMESNSVTEIKKAILSALNKKYREKCVNNCYKKLSKMITWKRTAEKILKIMDHREMIL